MDDVHTLALEVDNTGFLLDRLGEDCHPLQFLRELTQNSIEAVQRASGTGEIVWDVEWNLFESKGVYKLSITDTGDGMTGDEMVKYINRLSSSGGTQAFDRNYGVGAKIAAATRNHAGLLYLSWRENVGAMICLWRDSVSGVYGLRQLPLGDDKYGHWAPVLDDFKPALIQGHGTQVVLMGNDEDENTMSAPEGARSPSRWISRYLNTRYFCFPEGIAVRAREGWENPRENVDSNVLRRLTGQRDYLTAHADVAGSVPLTSATAHWWILRDEGALTQNSGYIASSGHVAALYQDELYELQEGRSGTARLQNFGVVLGPTRVVIYVQPDVGGSSRLTTNTARTQLLLNSEPLPWADWATEFRAALPEEIKELIAQVAAGSKSADHAKSIRDRLKQISDLLKLSRYRPSPGGVLHVDPDRVTGGVRIGGGANGKASGGTGGGSTPTTRTGNLHALYLDKAGVPADRVEPDPYPRTTWVSIKDGTRAEGDIEDRAAKYLADQNHLLINSDFRVFQDMTARWEKNFPGVPGASDVIEDEVRQWFEQALVETVMGVQGLQSSREWSVADIDAALSEEALTSSVMQRYHVDVALRRALHTRLGVPSKGG